MSVGPECVLCKPEVAEKDFEIEEVLAQRAFAVVKLATLRGTSEKVVLKFILVGEGRDIARVRAIAAHEEEMQRECMAISSRVVKCFGSFEVANAVVLVMEYVPGGSLSHHVRASSEQKRNWLAEIAFCLREFHRKGIVYRDLSQENVLVGADDHIRICDFGLTYRLSEGEASNQTGDPTLGSRAYRAPEIVRGLPRGRGVDRWSFGILAYWLLAGGESPYPSASGLKWLIKHHTFWMRSAIPEIADSLILGCLNRSRRQRLRDLQILTHEYFRGVNWKAIRAVCSANQPTGDDDICHAAFNSPLAAPAANPSLL